MDTALWHLALHLWRKNSPEMDKNRLDRSLASFTGPTVHKSEGSLIRSSYARSFMH
jgi:hypothetical protein